MYSLEKKRRRRVVCIGQKSSLLRREERDGPKGGNCRRGKGPLRRWEEIRSCVSLQLEKADSHTRGAERKYRELWEGTWSPRRVETRQGSESLRLPMKTGGNFEGRKSFLNHEGLKRRKR